VSIGFTLLSRLYNSMSQEEEKPRRASDPPNFVWPDLTNTVTAQSAITRLDDYLRNGEIGNLPVAVTPEESQYRNWMSSPPPNTFQTLVSRFPTLQLAIPNFGQQGSQALPAGYTALHLIQSMVQPTPLISPTISPPLMSPTNTKSDYFSGLSEDERPKRKRKETEKEKLFECKACNRTFARLEHLSRHERTHTGEKPFICPFPDCKKRFGRTDEVTRHLPVHYRVKERKNKKSSGDESLERNLKCPVCPKTLDNFIQLGKHCREIHNIATNYKCPLDGCEERMGSRQKVKKHLEAVHGISSLPDHAVSMIAPSVNSESSVEMSATAIVGSSKKSTSSTASPFESPVLSEGAIKVASNSDVGSVVNESPFMDDWSLTEALMRHQGNV
jgi:uncharacterized Zn-finger protein